MDKRVWHYEQSGQSVGPFTMDELQRLFDIGIIGPDTRLLNTDGRKGAASSVFDTGSATSHAGEAKETSAGPMQVDFASSGPPSLPLSLPPPPPLPQSKACSSSDTVASSQAASGKQSHETHPWNPRVIGQLGILFSPIWAGIMAAINSRRLQMDLPLWRPIVIGIGVTILDIVVSIVIGGYFVVHLVLYLGGLGLIWHLDLMPQLDAIEGNETECGHTAAWLVPVLVGVPAAVLVFLTFVVSPFIPDSSREEQAASTLYSGSGEGDVGEGSPSAEEGDSSRWLTILKIIVFFVFGAGATWLAHLDKFLGSLVYSGRKNASSNAIEAGNADPISDDIVEAEAVDIDGQCCSAPDVRDSCNDNTHAAASDDPGNPFSPTAVPTVATPEEIRLLHWTRLRETARWRRRSQLWFIVPLAFVIILLFTPESLRTLVFGLFWILLISWVPVWIWLTVKLRRALGSSDAANDVLDYLIPGYLDLRAHSVLRGAGVEVRLLGRDLPEEPPAWFRPQTM